MVKTKFFQLRSDIKKYNFKEGLPFEFEIIAISDLYRKSSNVLTKHHRANFYHIIWVQKGKPTHFVDFNPIKIETDSLLFVPKNCVHQFDIENEYEGKVILFTDDFFCKDNNDFQFLQSTILFNDLYEITQIHINSDNEEFEDIFQLMNSEFLKKIGDSQYDILRNLLQVFLLFAEREKHKQGFKKINAGANLEYLLLFKDLLEKNYKTSKSVGNYARDLSVTMKRLNKATSQILDKTPKQFIDERVILEAKRLLAHSTSSIKEIAYDLGFEEPTNFIKYFKNHLNITPSEFRENYL